MAVFPAGRLRWYQTSPPYFLNAILPLDLEQYLWTHGYCKVMGKQEVKVATQKVRVDAEDVNTYPGRRRLAGSQRQKIPVSTRELGHVDCVCKSQDMTDESL